MVTGGIGGCNSIYPISYKGSGTGRNYNEALIGGKFATCAITGDAYTNWLSQNSLNRGVTYLTSAIEIAAGATIAATGGGALIGGGMIAHGAGGVWNNIQQTHQASYMPPQITANEGSGDLNNCTGKNTFILYKMSITSERARIIDNYFTMYGYKINRLKTPALNSRTNWNYVKTIDANIEGYIPQESLQEIKDMFNTGVTFWHTTQYFLDYSRTNSIVS